MKKRAAFYTLGCKVNQYETEAVAGLFKQAGYEIVNFEEPAEVYVINTCTVTGLSDKKSGRMIRRARRNNSDALIVVMGCYSQVAPEEVGKIPGVNLIMGTSDRSKVVELVEKVRGQGGRIVEINDIMSRTEYEEMGIAEYRERTRAFVKIEDGCSQFCSYCIIPYARGPVRSRKPEDILQEVRNLVDGGYKEIVLTGIHVSSYGSDLKGISFLDIVEMIHDVDGLVRIRMGSLEPTDIDDGFIERCARLDKLCPHFHISLQSGCDRTLKRMNRKYTTDEYAAIIKKIRDSIRDVSITTDIMVGFPGETEDEFAETYEFVEDISFSKMHVFKYSPRKGTPAAGFENQVVPRLKEERSGLLLKLDVKKQKEFRESFIGREMDVLIERELKNRPGYVAGFTPNYMETALRGDVSMEGKVLRVKIEGIECNYLIGDIIL